MKTTQAADQARTDFHYFCSLLKDDVINRANSDAVDDKSFELCKNLQKIIEEAQEFYGHDAPVNESVLIVDIKTFEAPPEQSPKVVWVPQRIITLLRQTFQQAFVLILFLIPFVCGAQNDALGYVARVSTIHGDATELKVIEPSEPVSFTDGLVLVGAGDTVRVGLRLSCKEPQYIWSCYRVRVKISESATAFKYLDPNKKPLPKGCQILEIIWPFKKTADLPER